MASVGSLQSSVNQLNWTFESFDTGPAFYQSQSTAENRSQQMPEVQFNQSNWTKPVDAPFYLSSAQYCSIAFSGIIVLILCVIGFLTNLVTIFGLRRDPEKDNATIWLLKTLAVVDNVYLSLIFVAMLMETIAFYNLWTNAIWKVYYHICVGLQPLLLIAHTLAVWIVVLVTVARYLCIIRPMDIKWRNLRRMKVAVIWLIVLAVLLNIPTFPEVLMRIYYEEKCRLQPSKSSICLTINRIKNAFWICYSVLNSVIGSFIPLIILIILNLRIALALRTLKKKRRQMSLQMIRERSLTKTLVIVVAAFAVCQVPENIIFLTYIARFGVDDEALICALNVANALIVLNSPINFLIYCLLSKRFKQIFMDMLPCHKRQRTDVAVIV